MDGRMKFNILLTSTCCMIFFSVSHCFAEINYSEKLVKDVAQTYGYCTGQDITLAAIEKNFPSLKPQVVIARSKFSSAFGSSLENLESKMQSRLGKKTWDTLKNNIFNALKQNLEFTFTKEQSKLFIDEVKQRASGTINSPIRETLLLFNPDYLEYPEKEFFDGFVETYSSTGNTKAKGLDFTIKYPMSWIAKEGNRPNIVQKFSSVHRMGHTELMILIKNIPEFSRLNPSREDLTKMVNEIASEGDFKDFLPNGSILIASEKIVLETLPGIWLNYKYRAQRGRHSVEFEAISYMLFYKDKSISIQIASNPSINNEEMNHENLEKNVILLELMVNSFVLHDLY